MFAEWKNQRTICVERSFRRTHRIADAFHDAAKMVRLGNTPRMKQALHES